MSLPGSGLPLGANNPLGNKPLHYLIGADSAGPGEDGVVTVVAYDYERPVARGMSVAYCNLFDETNSGRYAPYLKPDATAENYNEGQIDPEGAGWERNLREQFERRRSQGFAFVELDNADAYPIEAVIGAIDMAASYGLRVVAKNPGLLDDDALTFVAHPNIVGIIVEEGAGDPAEMDALRRQAGKPDIPVWFVSFGDGRKWADNIAPAARNFPGMGVTYSSDGEYGDAVPL